MKLLGILNITDDSFSDAGKYLAPEAAIAHAHDLARGGADIIDIGAASSNPTSRSVPFDVEIGRLEPVVPALMRAGIQVSIDSYSREVQRWALAHNAAYLNDVQGFPYPELYGEIAASRAKLIVMHSVQGLGPATRVAVDPSEIFDRVVAFFETRLSALVQAGVSRERLIVDPGMGLFLGTRREASFTVLRRLGDLRSHFGLPVLVSVSRKSFLRTLLDRSAQEAAAATLGAELYAAVAQGADFIRTHDPRALKDALTVWNAASGRP